MNIKNEALFMSLSGYAAEMIKEKDNYNQVIYEMAQKIDRYFSKPKKRYNNTLLEQIISYLKNKIEPQLSGRIAPSLMLCMTLEYLIIEVGHIESRVAFLHYKNDIRTYLDSVEKHDKYRKAIFKHYKLLKDM